MKTIKRIQNSKFIKSKASLWGGLLVALLLTSCYQPKVVMHTIIHNDDSMPCIREVLYSNVMSQEMRDSLWGSSSVGWSQP